MFRHYLIIATRSLLRKKSFTLMNVLGLTVGMMAAILIFLYVRFQTSYDDFHLKADRIFRVVSDIKTPSDLVKAATVDAGWALGLKKDFPEVEDVVRFSWDGFLVKKGNVKFQEERTLLADSSLFKVFDFPLLEGDKSSALRDPMSVVLSEAAAKKYFGHEDPLGKRLRLTGAAIDARVTGLMKDIPENSQLHADMLVSMSSYQKIYGRPSSDSAGNNANLLTYVLLKPNVKLSAFEKKLPAFSERYTGPEMRKRQISVSLFLEPLRDVYLKTDHLAFAPVAVFASGSMSNVYIFSVIGIFLLLLACINFINLTTARSVERAREVGVRKVLGAKRWQLARQFLIESVMITLVAFVLALLLAQLLLPFFNQLAGKTICVNLFQGGKAVVLLLPMALVIGLLAGFYPSLVLSSFNPIATLKGRFATGRKGLLLRKCLVVTQFAVCIALICATLLVYKQLRFMKGKDLGFNKEEELIINTNFDKNRFNFKEAMMELPGVISAAWSSSVPGEGYMTANTEIANQNGDLQELNLAQYIVDDQFIAQYHLQLLAGRGFSRAFGTDSSSAIIINQSALKILGYRSADQAIGKMFTQWGGSGKIIGVVKDFNFKSLRDAVDPLSMRMIPSAFNKLSIKVSTIDLPHTLSAIKNAWNSIIPQRPFQYNFLDQSFDRQYRSETGFGRLFLVFAVVAILIGCLGLFGLSSYSTVERSKEISIRKIFGASPTKIVHLLLSEFIRPVLMAAVIAIPLVWPAMHRWLEAFAYRTSVSWWIFGVATLLAVMIAVLTTGYQVLKAAGTNSVKNLQTE
ncbi:putative ABC transport system permease protein [Arachidicoccus rhizosphaerae]|uniref:Putative ABC transport system permease protein n=1 Tax=Arachidicoccus rhizosphaerae TaxID=551991 RepID=A0A1H4CVA1_9BACT|nr:ABC transporter permease [Arachidicoccus rhizosphaerae]SEA64268.1 putative ABC transport system permease protein [Arachidicoccus rhizosphaerae]